MKYFESLNKKEFNECIDSFLVRNPRFEEVKKLNDFKEVPGYYMLVLDEYSQAYIGTSDDIFKRIYKHWHKRKSFDRLIFGYVENSIMSIASFRPLDTTRIYILNTKSTYFYEDKYINTIPEKFMCNRTWGGKMNGGFKEAIIKGKFREKIAQIEKPSIDIVYEDGTDLNPVQLHEIYMYVLENGFKMNTNIDGNENNTAIWVYQGYYGLYTMEGNIKKNKIAIKKVSNLH
ncbi:MAG: hypothetical protein K8Q99_06880 [Acholeplasmataceae bacterium]|nr:hypothetical protein [Acholeplasmataceae bacterium]